MVGLPQFKGQLERLGAAASGKMLGRAATAALMIVLNAIKERAPRLTRTLSRSFHIEVLSEKAFSVEAAVGTDLEYAAIHEFGGVITQKKAKMLHWVDRETGEDIFARSVTIPARPYVRPSWDENQDAMVAEIGAALEDLLRAALRSARG
jgi:hypothetical protein